ncbi:MAG: hypothetical protein ACE5F1_07435 [Planctomycetota bacterium]
MAICFGTKLAPGNEIPSMTATGRPVINKSYSANLGSAVGNPPAILLIGSSDKFWNRIPLPLDLVGIGSKGCNLRISPDVMVGTGTSGAGNASVSLPIPNNTSWVSLQYFHQHLVVDPAANAGKVVTTIGAKATIGQQ